jgi:hypothetical protein
VIDVVRAYVGKAMQYDRVSSTDRYSIRSIVGHRRAPAPRSPKAVQLETMYPS